MLKICQKLPLYSNIYLLQPESAIRGQAARSQIIARTINQPFKTTPNFHCLYKLIIYPPHEVSNSIVTSATSSKKSHYISIASITDKYSTLQLDEGKRETSTCISQFLKRDQFSWQSITNRFLNHRQLQFPRVSE